MKFKTLFLSALYTSFIVGISSASAGEHGQYEYATVLTAEPIVKVFHTATPEKNCWKEKALVRNPRRSSATGTIFGSLVGAAIGNAVGHNKTNKRIGAIAGAILGGSIGSDISQNSRATNLNEQWITRCETRQVTSEEERVVGYRVTYLYNDQTYTTRLSRDPGNSLKLRVTQTPVID